MKQINIISLLSAYKDLNKESFSSYLDYHSITIKVSELKDLQSLVDILITKTKNVALFDKYFSGYSIPQISKEFDLLRIDDETVVNIELKRTSTEDIILTQLIQNKYYLDFLNKELHSFTFVADTGKLYTLDDQNQLVEVSFKKLIEVLSSQNVQKINNIDSYFDPSNYLVSPFNSTKQFIKNKYFLTAHQEEIKKNTLKQFALPTTSIISIIGNAGTGKTLLTYDIAKEVSDTKETLVIHCGYLNEGHIALRDNYGWTIIPALNIVHTDLSKYYLIVVDEAQRIYPEQLDHLIKEVKKYSTNILFSYDGQQTLRKGEENNNVAQTIEKEVTIPKFELTDKIRTNKEVATFINCLFSKRRNLKKLNYENIELYYFNNNTEAKLFLGQLQNEDWKIINYTPDRTKTLPYERHNLEGVDANAHKVIGQEFNNVVAVIGEHFYYKGDYLSTKNYKENPYYHPTKMLFQIVSRTRIKLALIIINNEEVLNRCMEILNQK
ncbi:DUF2075 domain-containing protein [Flavobacterium sp. CHNK8]|uniref:DNA/RNA helicase domain-containing protein n=1 Tax=Flavobacterium sp. CHNK8 TaxID=2871165 RepID=UPI001C8EC8DB|nr:DNA/RNA helicase domain-containing protein [Flavobacterium sp. CHNK8]QZK90683.1 DUF2075 domain-containing protein [Flavobacterium sp. CHNK8]